MSRLRGPVAAGLFVLALGGVLGADRLAPPPEQLPEPAVIAAAPDPVSGGYVCGVGEATSGARVVLHAARPPTGVAGPASLEIQTFHEGARAVQDLPSIFPGAAIDVERTADEEVDEELTGTWLRWRDAPAAVWREWILEDAGDLPDMTVAGPCAAPHSPRWIVPGMTTEGGNEARLRLSNPFESAATFRVGFLTPAGVEEPLILRNLTVPAGSVREIVVNETLPEEADLAAVVEVVSGRMSVEGVQIARSAIGGIDGGSLLRAAPAAAEEWTVPWVSDGAASTSWLWIANPGERTAAVELTLHTPEGGELPSGLAEVSVPPGELRRIDLTGTFPQDVRTAAVTARSNGVPIALSAGTTLTAQDPARSGFAVQLGASGTDAAWVVSGGGAGDRSEQLHIVNPTGEDAVVDITLFNGVSSLEPDALQGREVAAGSTEVVPLDDLLDDRSRWSAFVTATAGEVVVGRLGRSEPDDLPLHLVAAAGTPSRAWSPEGTGLAAVSRPGLVRGLRSDPVEGGPTPES